jgi:hypothetical protein
MGGRELMAILLCTIGGPEEWEICNELAEDSKNGGLCKKHNTERIQKWIQNNINTGENPLGD